MTTWSTSDSDEAEHRYALGLALTLRQVAHILGLVHSRGEQRGHPDRRQVLDLIGAGQLRPIDPGQPTHRLTVSATEVRRRIEGDTPHTPPVTLEEGA